MSIIRFNDQTKTIKWMRNMIVNYPGELFDGSSQNYKKFWQMYVDLKDINLPSEMDFPYKEEYFLEDIKESYSDWYKRKYKEFCEKITIVKDILDAYLYIS